MTAPFTGRIKGHPEWLTPRAIVDALGPFDLDPCAPIVRPWPTAAQHYTELDDGLSKPWHGRVWLNPPYGPREPGRWLPRLKAHGNGIALVFPRTETRWFFESIWGGADAVLFKRGRIAFCHVDGTPTAAGVAPCVFAAFGQNNVDALHRSGIDGIILRIRE